MERGLKEREVVATRERIRERPAIRKRGREVGLVDLRDQRGELIGDALELLQELLRVLRRLLAFLHEHADLQPFPELLGPDLQLTS